MSYGNPSLPPAVPAPDTSVAKLLQRLGAYVARCHQLEEVLEERAIETNGLHDQLLAKHDELTHVISERDRWMHEAMRLNSELQAALADRERWRIEAAEIDKPRTYVRSAVPDIRPGGPQPQRKRGR